MYFFLHLSYYHLIEKGNLPSLCLSNSLYPGDIPVELEVLTDIELSLVSQLKPYMKLIKLRGGKHSQMGVKGSIVSFPQDVQEIPEQLPLRVCDSNVIIVSETLDRVKRKREFEIRPDFLKRALLWLQTNNHLYRNIDIVDRDIETDLNIENIVQIVPKNHIDTKYEYNYLRVQDYIEILNGTIRSHSPIFSNYGEFLSKAASVMSIVFSELNNIDSWTCNILNTLLFQGYVHLESIESITNIDLINLKTKHFTGKISFSETDSSVELEIEDGFYQCEM